MPTIQSYIVRRNVLQQRAEDLTDELGDLCEQKLEAVNEHIRQTREYLLPLTPYVEREIETCLRETKAWLDEQVVEAKAWM